MMKQIILFTWLGLACVHFSAQAKDANIHIQAGNIVSIASGDSASSIVNIGTISEAETVEEDVLNQVEGLDIDLDIGDIFYQTSEDSQACIKMPGIQIGVNCE